MEDRLHDSGCCSDGTSVEIRWCGRLGRYRALCHPCPHQPALWDEVDETEVIERADLHDLIVAIERVVRLRQIRLHSLHRSLGMPGRSRG